MYRCIARIAGVAAICETELVSNFVRDVCRNVVAFGSERVTVDSDRRSALRAHLTDTRDRLSPKQFMWVWKLVLKYRHRIDRPDLVDRALRVLPGGVINEP